jgi:hypothetical protein
LRNLDQTGFNRIEQPEIRNDPGERLADFVARSLDKERGGGKINTEIDAALAAAAGQFVDPVEPFNPDGGFAGVLLGQVFILIEELLIPGVLSTPVSVVCFIIEDQPVRAAALPTAEFLPDALKLLALIEN